MTEAQDNAGEVVADAVRVALTAAGQLAEQAARRREADLLEAERDSAVRIATLQSQLAAERELALRSVRDVVQRVDPTVEEVVRAWEQACTWDDPSMAAEQAQLEGRLRDRFGVDGSNFVANRNRGAWASAASLTVRDVQQQADDAHRRGGSPIDSARAGSVVPSSSMDKEAVAARTLADQSHPIPAAHAARRPRAIPTAKMGRGRRGGAVEMQEPGR